MNLCSRCHKRPAVIFMTRIDGNQTLNEGICIKCAKELGIPSVQDLLDKMGISDEDLNNMDGEFGLLAGNDDMTDTNDEAVSNAPAVDMSKIFGQLQQQSNQGNTSDKKDKNEKNKQPKRKYLDAYCINLTLKAKKGELDSVIGRKKELERLIQILGRRQKNNPCLIGEPGVGKTAIAEALAQKISTGDVPYKMQNKEVYMLDLTALVAGTQFRGQFEGRMKGLIEEIKQAGNIILVIDEVHNIVGAGDAEGSMNAANILKPALSRGELQVIGATTLAEYRKYIEKDAALERRFQPIIINEPSIEDAVEILMGIKKYYEAFHGITIPDDTVRRAVILSERYIEDRFLPDKAIDLLDEAASSIAIKSTIISDIDKKTSERKRVSDEMETLELEQTDEAGQLEEKYKKIAILKSEEIRLDSELAELNEKRKGIVLTTEHLAKVIEIWTGIPASNITESEFKRVSDLAKRLKEKIVGQDEAINSVCKAIKRNRAGIHYKRKPVSFIFAGPTGVGKTELVKTLANDLFDSPDALIRLDMSEYMEKHAVSRIIGSPPGYVGYDEAGQLTEKVRRRPYSVILFDEIEKAHPDIMNILLQILDDGRITDAHGRTVNFENTVIVLTTNAGSDYSVNAAGFEHSTIKKDDDRTQKALSGFLRPEFLNRIDEIITFNSLNKDNFREISKIMLADLEKVLAEKSIIMSYTDSLLDLIVEKSFSKKYGARNMRRYIEQNVEDKIANEIIDGYKENISLISVDVRDAEVAIFCK